MREEITTLRIFFFALFLREKTDGKSEVTPEGHERQKYCHQSDDYIKRKGKQTVQFRRKKTASHTKDNHGTHMKGRVVTLP